LNNAKNIRLLSSFRQKLSITLAYLDNHLNAAAYKYNTCLYRDVGSQNI